MQVFPQIHRCWTPPILWNPFRLALQIGATSVKDLDGAESRRVAPKMQIYLTQCAAESQTISRVRGTGASPPENCGLQAWGDIL